MTKIWSKLSLIFGAIVIFLFTPISYLVITTLINAEPKYLPDVLMLVALPMGILSLITGIVGLKREKAKYAIVGIILGLLPIFYYLSLFIQSFTGAPE